MTIRNRQIWYIMCSYFPYLNTDLYKNWSTVSKSMLYIVYLVFALKNLHLLTVMLHDS